MDVTTAPTLRLSVGNVDGTVQCRIIAINGVSVVISGKFNSFEHIKMIVEAAYKLYNLFFLTIDVWMLFTALYWHKGFILLTFFFL